MEGLLRKDLVNRLINLDEEASLIFDGKERLHIIIVGGSALVLLEVLDRATHDIDAIDVSAKLRGMIEQYDINTRVQTYINNFPYNYEDRLQKLDIPGKIIDFYAASLEDIVIAKLHSFRDSDQKDVTEPYVLSSINWEKLHHLAFAEDESKQSALNDRQHQEFLASYEEYEKRYRPCDS